jgi:hypothetical protein
MKRTLLVVVLLLGLSGLACSTVSLPLPFLSTPTPTATNTPRPTSTPRSTQTLVPTGNPALFMSHMQECLDLHFGAGKNLGAWKPLFCDDFSHAQDWVPENYSDTPGKITKAVIGGSNVLRWVVEASVNNTFIDFLPISPDSLKDFDFSLREVKVSGPNSWFGIVFRYQEATQSYYIFLVDYANLNTSVWLMDGSQWVPVKDWAPSSAIHKADSAGAWNTLSVRGEGTSYACSVNGEVVQVFEDDRLPAGWLGIGVAADPNTTTVFNFDDFVVLGKP